MDKSLFYIKYTPSMPYIHVMINLHTHLTGLLLKQDFLYTLCMTKKKFECANQDRTFILFSFINYKYPMWTNIIYKICVCMQFKMYIFTAY